jgi:hypothetical protein
MRRPANNRAQMLSKTHLLVLCKLGTLYKDLERDVMYIPLLCHQHTWEHCVNTNKYDTFSIAEMLIFIPTVLVFSTHLYA